MADELLRVEKLNKSFGVTHANKNITMTLDQGEIRGLAGENGSGKSTLTSMISGMQAFDSGKMFIHGKEYAPHNPLEANEYKVSMVVQELGVITSLSGAKNLFLGKMESFTALGIVNTRKMVKAARDIFAEWGLGEVPLEIPAAHLTMEQRKLIELARALSIDPDLLVLDEITQSLSHDTRQIIYHLKDKFKKRHKSMIIISHDLEETVDICDSITVLRDGEVVTTVSTEEITTDDLKQYMIGRKLEGDYYRTDESADYEDEVLLEVKDLGLKNGKLKNISFELHKGEILAVCGLSDAGIHTLGSAIFGMEEGRTGTVTDKNCGKELKTPLHMIRQQGAYLSKNRDEEGLMLQASIRDNLYIPSANELAGFLGYTKKRDINGFAQKAYDDFDVKATGIMQPIGRLSGGNKQKINLGRWLSKDLKYMILDCPTRGVDIGVKAYIYDILRKQKKEGVGFILISDELPEAIGMADRILILNNGEIKGEMTRGSNFSESKIIEVMI